MNQPTAVPEMTGLLDFHLAHDAQAAWYRYPEIPPKKLENAIAAYAPGVPAESVLALGDGTVFGSAKEGVLITADTFFAGTSEGLFAAPLDSLAGAGTLGGWPGYGVEVQCRDGRVHNLSMSCFNKQQDSLVAFLNAVATRGAECVASEAPLTAPPVIPVESLAAGNIDAQDTSTAAVNAGLKLFGVCRHDEWDDVGQLFEAAFQADTEWPLLKAHCQYVGFNGREVDGIVLLTNRRLLLFSMESGVKIVCVELTRRLLDKLPLPFVDSIICFLLFSIPRFMYVAARGGRDQIIAQTLAGADDDLLSNKTPLRKVQEFDIARLAQTVSQVDLGHGVWTGILSRKFGISFASGKLAGAFSVPHDLILAEHDSLAPFERLLNTVRATLARAGLSFRGDANGEQLTLAPVAAADKAAA